MLSTVLPSMSLGGLQRTVSRPQREPPPLLKPPPKKPTSKALPFPVLQTTKPRFREVKATDQGQQLQSGWVQQSDCRNCLHATTLAGSRSEWTGGKETEARGPVHRLTIVRAKGHRALTTWARLGRQMH